MRQQAVGLADAALTADDDLGREFGAAIAHSLPLVFRVAYGVLRDRAEAEDVSQEAFAKGYRKFKQLRDRNALRAWLVRIAWRLAINRQRANRRRTARELTVQRETETMTAPDTCEREERAARVWAAIDALPPKLRMVTRPPSAVPHAARVKPPARRTPAPARDYPVLVMPPIEPLNQIFIEPVAIEPLGEIAPLSGERQ